MTLKQIAAIAYASDKPSPDEAFLYLSNLIDQLKEIGFKVGAEADRIEYTHTEDSPFVVRLLGRTVEEFSVDTGHVEHKGSVLDIKIRRFPDGRTSLITVAGEGYYSDHTKTVGIFNQMPECSHGWRDKSWFENTVTGWLLREATPKTVRTLCPDAAPAPALKPGG